MANVNNLYPSNYIKAADLQGHVVRVTIKNVVNEKIGNDSKPILYFEGKAKGLVMNKTNGMTIAAVYGPETDNWVGGELELFPAFVDFQGRQVEAVRVRIPTRQPAAAPARAPIVPNARQAQQQPNPPAPAMAGGEDPFDDEVPF